MVLIADLLTITWLLGWAVFAIRLLSRNSSASVLWVILVHIAFTGLPIALNHLIGIPNYKTQPGFRIASVDVQTALIYDAYISAVPVLLWMFGRSRKPAESSNGNLVDQTVLDRLQRYWGWFLVPLVAPLVLAAFAPDPTFYFEYGATVTSPMTKAQTDYHALIALTARLSLGAAAVLLLVTRRVHYGHIVFLLPFVTATVWIHGKRSIVAMTLVLFAFVFWQKGLLRGPRLAVAGLIAIAAMSVFSFTYQANVRDLTSASSPFELYENARIDYGRDAQIKMTIYAELHPDEMQILEHRGQSFLFYATMYVPRAAWPEKPLPYAQYFTSAMLLQEPRSWGWGMTTSWLEEPIANIGWLGMILGPVIPAFICRISDSRSSVAIRLVGTLLAILLLTVQMVGLVPIVFLWLVLLARSRRIKASGHEISREAPRGDWSSKQATFLHPRA